MNLQLLFIGIRFYPKAISFIAQHKLRYFYIFPFVFYVFVFLIGSFGISELSENSLNWLKDFVERNEWQFFGMEVFSSLLFGVVWLLFRILFFLLFAYLGGYIVLIIMSPVLAFLSEKVETILTGKEYRFRWDYFLKDVFRGVIVATRNMFIEIALIIVLFIAGFIPLVGLIVPVLLVLISAYFYGYSFVDYTLERKRLNLKSSVGFARKNKIKVAGVGLPFACLFLIPFIGSFIASFFSIIACVAATMVMFETVSDE